MNSRHRTARLLSLIGVVQKSSFSFQRKRRFMVGHSIGGIYVRKYRVRSRYLANPPECCNCTDHYLQAFPLSANDDGTALVVLFQVPLKPIPL